MHWRRDRLPTPVFLGFPHASAGKESACNAGDLGSIPGLERSPESGEGKGYPLQYSGLENCMDCIVHGVPKSWTQLNDFHSHSPQNCQIDFSNTCFFPLPSSETLNGSILPIAVVSKTLSPFCQWIFVQLETFSGVLCVEQTNLGISLVHLADKGWGSRTLLKCLPGPPWWSSD